MRREKFPDEGKLVADCLADFGGKVGSASVFYRSETNLNEEIRKLKQERDDSNLQTMIMEETYVVLLKSLKKDFSSRVRKFGN